MAPTLMATVLGKRYYCNDYYDDCDYSGWNNWGRWVALAVIIVAFIILALGFSCINNRRRRNRGAPPMYGTGWMPAPPGYKPPENGQYYPNQPYNGGAAAPPYSPPINNQATGNTFNSNEGYYGHHGYGQQSGVELQQPTNVYQPQREVDHSYEAPVGPPPGKGEYSAVVR